MLKVPWGSSLTPPLADSKPKPPLADSKPKPPLADSKPKPPPADYKPKHSPADSKTQEGKKNEEMALPASRNPGSPRQGGGGNPPLPPPQTRVDLRNQGTQATNTPPSCDERTVSPSRTSQGTQCGPGAPQTGAGPCQLRQLPAGGMSQSGQPMAYYWAHTPLSVSDLLTWKSVNASYKEDPQKTIDFIAYIFSTHQPNWADVEALLHILLTSDERKLVRDKAMEEAFRLYVQDPTRNPNPARAVPVTEPHWDVTSGGLVPLGHYRRCILEGLRRGVTKKNSLDRVWAIQQKLDEDPADFLERIYQAFRKYTDIDPEEPQNACLVNQVFISQSAPHIKRKLQRLTGALGMDSHQLVRIAVSYSQKMEIQKQTIIFINSGSGWKETKWRRPLGPNQCAYCKQEGHWKRECPKLALKAYRRSQLRNRMIGWPGDSSDSDEE